MASKYIIFDNELAVCFHKDLIHHDVATMHIGDYEASWGRKFPTSAGFFTIESELSYQTADGSQWPEGRVITRVHAYGKSDSLDLSMDAGDKYLIAKALGIDYEEH
jgi:hypothetical protein